jgi:hypothetical protein
MQAKRTYLLGAVAGAALIGSAGIASSAKWEPCRMTHPAPGTTQLCELDGNLALSAGTSRTGGQVAGQSSGNGGPTFGIPGPPSFAGQGPSAFGMLPAGTGDLPLDITLPGIQTTEAALPAIAAGVAGLNPYGGSAAPSMRTPSSAAAPAAAVPALPELSLPSVPVAAMPGPAPADAPSVVLRAGATPGDVVAGVLDGSGPNVAVNGAADTSALQLGPYVHGSAAAEPALGPGVRNTTQASSGVTLTADANTATGQTGSTLSAGATISPDRIPGGDSRATLGVTVSGGASGGTGPANMDGTGIAVSADSGSGGTDASVTSGGSEIAAVSAGGSGLGASVGSGSANLGASVEAGAGSGGSIGVSVGDAGLSLH